MALYRTDQRRDPANRSLDLVRGLAAVLVVLGHTRNYTLAAFGLEPAPDEPANGSRARPGRHAIAAQ